MSSIQRIVVVMSTNYAGSHLLSHLLSAHPKCFGVGEIHRYSQLLDDQSTAPVVAEYANNPIYRGLDRVPVAHWHSEIGRRIDAENPPVIVDNSKKVKWLNKIRGNPNYDIRLVHLLRDPRALVARWFNTYTDKSKRRVQRFRVAKRMPRYSPEILTGNWETVFIYKWLRENIQVHEFVEASGFKFARVTYRDLAFEAEDTLHRLMPTLDLMFDPAQLRFGESDTLGTTKVDHAETVSRSEIKPDLKWQTQLSPESRSQVEEHRVLNDFLNKLDLGFADNGLTRLT